MEDVTIKYCTIEDKLNLGGEDVSAQEITYLKDHYINLWRRTNFKVITGVSVDKEGVSGDGLVGNLLGGPWIKTLTITTTPINFGYALYQRKTFGTLTVLGTGTEESTSTTNVTTNAVGGSTSTTDNVGASTGSDEGSTGQS